MHELIRVLPWVVVAALVALRLWRRGTRRSAGPAREARRMTTAVLRGDAGLIAAREVRERVRGRVFRVVTVLILGVVAAAIVLPVVGRGKTQRLHAGVVGPLSASQRAAVAATAASVGSSVVLVPEPDRGAAERGLRSGNADVVIVGGGELVVDKPIGSADTSAKAQFVRGVARTLGIDRAFEAAGLSPAQAQQVSGATALPVNSLQGGGTRGPGRPTSVVGLILVFVMLTQYNTWTLIGVMEEKASRVVEVLLAAVRPMQLLGGKVLGIGLVVLAQAALIVAFALILAKAVGSDLLRGAAPTVVGATLVWLVLGYAFYCWVYAAAGSMAERQDQVQSMALPLSLPIIVGYVLALTAAASGSASTLTKVLGYLPPTAPFAMPVLVGLGAVRWWGFAASVALSVVSTVAVARLAAVIYRKAVLRTGRRVRLREVVTGGA